MSAANQRPSFLQSLKAVAWSFFGVRRSGDHEKDLSNANPVHLVIAALLAVAIFIGVLITVVRLVTS